MIEKRKVASNSQRVSLEQAKDEGSQRSHGRAEGAVLPRDFRLLGPWTAFSQDIRKTTLEASG